MGIDTDLVTADSALTADHPGLFVDVPELPFPDDIIDRKTS